MLPRALLLRVIGIAAGSFALAATWSLYNVHMPLLLGEFIESRALRGAIMGLDNVLALLLIPVVGAWSDRVEGRWGRRLPFLLAAVPVTALAFALLPWAAAALWTLLLVDVVFLLAITVYRAPLVALMPDHVPEALRSDANAVVTLTAAAGGVVALLLLAPTFDAAIWIPFALAALLLLAGLAVVLSSAQPHPPHVSSGAVQDEAPLLAGLVRDARDLARPERRGALLLLLGLFACFFGFAGVEAQFSVLATETLGVSGGRAGQLLGLASLAFVASAVPAGSAARRIGSLTTMRLGAAVLTVALVGAFAAVTLAPAATGALAACLVLAGLGWALVLVPAYPLVVGFGGRAQIGFYTGMYYLFGSAAAIVAPATVGVGMDAFGNRALFLVAALALLCGTAALRAAARR